MIISILAKSMYCQHCGNKIEDSEKFCSKCGYSVVPKATEDTHHAQIADDKWYLRLAKVIYIFLYIPLPFTLWGVWTSSDPYSYYSSYSREWISYGSYEEAFWYSLLTLVIWIGVLRLLKIAVLYIATGRKPVWKREFRKLF